LSVLNSTAGVAAGSQQELRAADVAVSVAWRELTAWSQGARVGAVEKYLAPTGYGKGARWCAAFVSWCYYRASCEVPTSMPFEYSAWARGIFFDLKRRGLTDDSLDARRLRRGDLIFWWRVAHDHWRGHVGIVVEVEKRSFATIEGNRDGAVKMFKYPAANLRRFLGVAYL
jgi:hypothetical protein